MIMGRYREQNNQAYIQWDNGSTWFLSGNLHIVGIKYKGNKGEGVTIVESLGLALAVGETKLNCNTLSEVDMSARKASNKTARQLTESTQQRSH